MEQLNQDLMLREARRLGYESVTGRWTLPDLNDVLVKRTGRRTKAGATMFSEVVANGSIVSWSSGNRTEYSAAPAADSLADLLTLAKTAIAEPTLAAKRPGRRARTGESLIVETITAKDYTKIVTACNTIARYIQPGVCQPGIPEVLQRIKREYFAWDPDARAGGDWRLILDLTAKASTALSPNETSAKVSAVRKLMDLAATHYWIPRSMRHAANYEAIPAAWAELYEEFRSSLVGSGLNVKAGLLALFEGCARLGMCPRSANWHRVVEHMEDTFTEQRTRSSTRSGIRAVYRALHHGDHIDGPAWDGRARQREAGLSLVSAGAIAAVAGMYGADTEQTGLREAAASADWQGPVWKGFESYPQLVHGPYGLRRMLVHFTCDISLSKDYDVPNRVIYPRQRTRAASERTSTAWRAATISAALEPLLHYAGWLERHRGTQFKDIRNERGEISAPGNDLRVLINADNLRAYRHAVLVGGHSTKGRLLRLVKVLARIASPYLEATALSLNDEPLANSMADVSAMLSGSNGYNGEVSWVKGLRGSREERVAKMRRKALAVQNIWTRHEDVCAFAYEQLERIRAEILLQIATAGGMPLDAQVHAIESGQMEPTREWARLVRDATYWQDQLIVPLRVATSSRLDLAERRHSADYRRIRADIPAKKMKSSANGAFDPNYRSALDSPYVADLYRLYVMDDGARQILRTDATGQLIDVAAFYVPDACTTGGSRISTDGFRDIVDRIVQTCEHVLGGVTYQELKRAHVLGTHFFRHAYGTIMVRNNLTDIASYYLHQSDTTMLRQVYSANTAGSFDGAAMLGRMRRGTSDKGSVS